MKVCVISCLLTWMDILVEAKTVLQEMAARKSCMSFLDMILSNFIMHMAIHLIRESGSQNTGVFTRVIITL